MEDDSLVEQSDPHVEKAIMMDGRSEPIGKASEYEMLATPDRGDAVPKYAVSPRAVAVGAGLFGLSCLTALAIVAGVAKADELSTIALALAILAFVVQLLTFIVQSQTASQQMVRSEQLNTHTRALLAEMQTTARSTEGMVREQFGQLLRAFMDAATSAESKGAFDPEAFERRLLSNVRRETAAIEATQRRQAERPSNASSSGARSAGSEVNPRGELPFPSEEEAQSVIADLRTLSRPAVERLNAYARDKRTAQTSGFYEGFAVGAETDTVDQELRNCGFIRLVRLPPEGGPSVVHQLTEKGELGARVFVASGPIPPWAEEFFQAA